MQFSINVEVKLYEHLEIFGVWQFISPYAAGIEIFNQV